jgi:hypothetical protein
MDHRKIYFDIVLSVIKPSLLGDFLARFFHLHYLWLKYKVFLHRNLPSKNALKKPENAEHISNLPLKLSYNFITRN